MLPVGIGEAIRARRERAGLTQESLGALLAVHPDVIDDWEWGEAAPEPWQARRLALILGLPEGALLPEASPEERGGAIVVQLVTPAGEEPSEVLVTLPAPAAPAVVPPPPGQPPPAPVSPRRAAGGRALPAGPPAPAGVRPRAWSRRALTGLAAALLVSIAATSGLTAYRQGQLAARYEAEARALRATLVVLAGERDRLAARLGELSAALAEAGVLADGAEAAPRP